VVLVVRRCGSSVAPLLRLRWLVVGGGEFLLAWVRCRIDGGLFVGFRRDVRFLIGVAWLDWFLVFGWCCFAFEAVLGDAGIFRVDFDADVVACRGEMGVGGG